LPRNAFGVCPFGSLEEGGVELPWQGISLAVDSMFFMSEVPLISGCLDVAYGCNNETCWSRICSGHLPDLLRARAASRIKADWALSGDLQILPVSYSGHSMRAVLSMARTCPKTGKIALICVSFYKYPLIYEVDVKSLPFFKKAPVDSIICVRSLIDPEITDQYYTAGELGSFGSAIFLDVGPFKTEMYELTSMPPG
jgi:hypothetical protein